MKWLNEIYLRIHQGNTDPIVTQKTSAVWSEVGDLRNDSLSREVILDVEFFSCSLDETDSPNEWNPIDVAIGVFRSVFKNDSFAIEKKTSFD